MLRAPSREPRRLERAGESFGRRRTVVLAAAVLAGVLLIVVLATGWAGSGNSAA